MIFARLALQRQLDELRIPLGEESKGKLAARLNKPGKDRLAAMWEVAILHAVPCWERDGRRYLWRDLVALRRNQTKPRPEQPTLFALREDHRPPGERTAAERYLEPNLFTLLQNEID